MQVRLRVITLLIFLVLGSACSTVTLRDKSTGKLSADPTYESSKAFFFWGLAGEHHLDVTQLCNGKSPRQIQAQNTFLDGFLGAITLGIY